MVENLPDTPEFAKKSELFSYLNPKTNLIEVMNITTGEIVAIQRSYADLYSQKADNLVKYTIEGREVWVEPSIDLDGLRKNLTTISFSQTIADIISQKILEGGKIGEICKTPGFPSYSQFCRWKRDVPGFREQILEAQKDRAMLISEETLSIADDSGDSPEEIAKSKLRIDARRHLASKDDAGKYGTNKLEVSGNQPLQFIISTGIDRTPIKDVADSGDASSVEAIDE